MGSNSEKWTAHTKAEAHRIFPTDKRRKASIDRYNAQDYRQINSERCRCCGIILACEGFLPYGYRLSGGSAFTWAAGIMAKESVCSRPEPSGSVACDLCWTCAAAQMVAPSLEPNRLAGGGYLRLLVGRRTGD